MGLQRAVLLRCAVALAVVVAVDCSGKGRRGGYIETEGSFMMEESWASLSNRAGNSEAELELGERSKATGRCNRIANSAKEACALLGEKDSACVAMRRGHQQRCKNTHSHLTDFATRGTSVGASPEGFVIPNDATRDDVVELGDSLETRDVQGESDEPAPAATLSSDKTQLDPLHTGSGGTAVLPATQQAASIISASAAATVATSDAAEPTKNVTCFQACAPGSCLTSKFDGCTVCKKVDHFPHILRSLSQQGREIGLAGKCVTPRDEPVNSCVTSGCFSLHGKVATSATQDTICTRICKYGGRHTVVTNLLRKDGSPTLFSFQRGVHKVSAPECLLAKTSICKHNKNFSIPDCTKCAKLWGTRRHECRMKMCVRESCSVTKKVSCFAIVPYRVWDKTSDPPLRNRHNVDNELFKGPVTDAMKAECELIDNPCKNIARTM